LSNKIRVGAVNYLNTKPLLWGIENTLFLNEIDLVKDYPARLANMLVTDELDIALVPVAIIPKLPNANIITDYCIAANNEVASVCLFSDEPIEAIENIYLDYQSKTSVALLKILLKEYWKVQPNLIEATEKYESNISGTQAGLIIGDRAFEQLGKNRYVYDLAAAWKAHTNLPFVFAAWVANKTLPEAFIQNFNEHLAQGQLHLAAIIEKENYPFYDLEKYYTENISYILDEEKRKGMELFLSKITS
jgi:chorismate dehydratase